jgi:hypothetical protein
MKSALVGLLPYIDDLIQRAAAFVKSIDRAKIENAAQSQLDTITPAGTPEEAGIKIGVTPESAAAMKDFTDGNKTIWQQIVAAATILRASLQYISPQDVKWTAGTSPVMDSSAATMQAGKNTAAWLAEADAWKKLSADAVSGADAMAGGFSKVAKTGNDANDAFDRSINTVKKHTDQLYADADAVGLSAGDLEKFRVEAQLMSAAEAAGVPITEQLKAKISDLGDTAKDARNDLEKLNIAAQIKFDRATIGLSPEDVQIATQLRKLYPDVTDALNSTEAADIRLNNQLKLGKEIVTSFGNDLVAGLMRGETAMKSLETAATNLITKLASKNLTNFLNGGSLFGNQSLDSAQGAVGMASAGLSGYQSGNPLTGALGGAMAGATFGPAGAAIGGALGLIGGLIGQDSQAAAALKQAQDQWHAMSLQVADFNLAAAGTGAPLVNALQKRPSANDNEKKDKSHDCDEHRKAA